MKILVFSPYYPPHVGGLENYSKELNEKLASQGNEVFVFTANIPKIDSQKKYNLIEIRRAPFFEIISGYPLPKLWARAFWRNWNEMKNQDFDCVVSHTRFFPTSLLAYCFSVRKKIRWIHIEHGSDFVAIRWPFNWISRLYDYTLGRLILKKADVIIAISKSVAAFVRHLAPKVSPEIIYRGFDIDKYVNKVDKPLVSNAFKIIFIGRLFSGKGVDYLLEALHGLKDRNFQLRIVGDGPEKENLKNLGQKLGINDRIIFAGQLKHEKALEHLQSSDLFINPSLNEGLPTTVIEAALCKIPIIATDVGGTKEIIIDGESGLLVPPKNSTMLSQKISELMSDQKKRLLFGENAFVDTCQKFNWDSNLIKIINVLKNGDA